MMKKLITILLLFNVAYGQYLKPNNSYGTITNRVAPDSVLHIPDMPDTLNIATTQSARPQIRVVGDSVWWYKNKWRNLSDGRNIYNSDGVLKSNRSLDGNNFSLYFGGLSSYAMNRVSGNSYTSQVSNSFNYGTKYLNRALISGRGSDTYFDTSKTFFGYFKPEEPGSYITSLGIYQDSIVFVTGKKRSGHISKIGQSVLLGYQAGLNTDVTAGLNNVFIGYDAANYNTDGYWNTSTGMSSFYQNTTGFKNTANGMNSLFTNTTGSLNSAFGFSADVSGGNFTNATAIGAHAYAGASDALVLGSINGINGAVADTKIGIGTTTPAERLHVVGNLKLVNGSQGDKKILISDANGLTSFTSSFVKNLNTNTAQVGNVGAGQDDLMTYTLPANTLANNGDKLEFKMVFTFAANANLKEIGLWFGGSDFYHSSSENQNDGSLTIRGTIARISSTSQLTTIEQVGSDGSLFTTHSEYYPAAEDLTTNLVVKATAIGVSNNDIVQILSTIDYIPSN